MAFRFVGHRATGPRAGDPMTELASRLLWFRNWRRMAADGAATRYPSVPGRSLRQVRFLRRGKHILGRRTDRRSPECPQSLPQWEKVRSLACRQTTPANGCSVFKETIDEF